MPEAPTCPPSQSGLGFRVWRAEVSCQKGMVLRAHGLSRLDVPHAGIFASIFVVELSQSPSTAPMAALHHLKLRFAES